MRLKSYFHFKDNTRHYSFEPSDKIACAGDSGAPITSGGKVIGLHQYGNCNTYASAASISDAHYFVQGRLNAWEKKITPLKVKVTFADPIRMVRVEDDSGRVKCELKATGECNGEVPIGTKKETVKLSYFYDDKGEERIKPAQFLSAGLGMKWPRTEAEEFDKILDPRSAQGLGYAGGVSEVPLDGREIHLELFATAKALGPKVSLSVKNSPSSTGPSAFEIVVDGEVVRTTKPLAQGQEEIFLLGQDVENVLVRAKTRAKYLKVEQCSPGAVDGVECAISSISGANSIFNATFQVGQMAAAMLTVDGSSYTNVSISGPQTQVGFTFWAEYVESCRITESGDDGVNSLAEATGRGSNFAASGYGQVSFREVRPNASGFLTKVLTLNCTDLDGGTVERAISVTKTYSPPTAQITGPSSQILPPSGSLVVSFQNSFDCVIQSKLQNEAETKFSDVKAIPNAVEGSVSLGLENEWRSKTYRVNCLGYEVTRWMVTFQLPSASYFSVDAINGILSFAYSNAVSAYLLSPTGTRIPVAFTNLYAGLATVSLSEEGTYQVVILGPDEQTFQTVVYYWPPIAPGY